MRYVFRVRRYFATKRRIIFLHKNNVHLPCTVIAACHLVRSAFWRWIVCQHTVINNHTRRVFASLFVLFRIKVRTWKTYDDILCHRFFKGTLRGRILVIEKYCHCVSFLFLLLFIRCVFRNIQLNGLKQKSYGIIAPRKRERTHGF